MLDDYDWFVDIEKPFDRKTYYTLYLKKKKKRIINYDVAPVVPVPPIIQTIKHYNEEFNQTVNESVNEPVNELVDLPFPHNSTPLKHYIFYYLPFLVNIFRC